MTLAYDFDHTIILVSIFIYIKFVIPPNYPNTNFHGE